MSPARPRLTPRSARPGRWPGLVLMALAAAFVATAAVAAPGDGGSAYRTLFEPDGRLGFLNPRIIAWVLAQLHLLFAAFVLAVPMFAVIIEIVGIASKDPEQSARYDNLAHEFTRLLTTAFSATSIIGAVFTFTGLYMYPKLFGYLVDVFGKSMVWYACIFFGESFSLYFYYYGWGKFSRKAHAAIGVLLNVFGVTLMFIANAWTTFTMAPGGLDEAGKVVDSHAAFFNFLLYPINTHRLIANLCMGGSVAAAYAAYKFLSTSDPVKRAHYDWMGYIGNFVAVLALLPLPFAGYYLGFEIYAFNQQLGIYMMGGNLSWLFIMQAVLIGVLFLSANYYLWLGMDRIEGAERYRGWIKWLLAVIALGVMVWATPKSLMPNAAEIEAMKGTNHPILSIFGLMSAKNTAVNLVILATFLSFVLYRRGNKIPTVAWASRGRFLQALFFGLATAVVVVIGVGGYVKSMWLESSLRIAMSPWQVVAVLACMVGVMVIDVPLLKGAKEIGPIRWGQVSRRSQYTLILLAVSFTWLMGLMGFVRSSLRQHWHVYEVMKDESPWAFTPGIGYATVVVTCVVMIFFLMVSLIFWISSLGAHEAHAEEAPAAAPSRTGRLVAAIAAVLVVGALVRVVMGGGGGAGAVVPLDWVDQVRADREAMEQQVHQYARLGPGAYQVPIARAIDLVAGDPSLLQPIAIAVPAGGGAMTPAQRGDLIFNKLQPCATCHSVDGTPRIGPTVKGLFGSRVTLVDGRIVVADEAFLRESILSPLSTVVQGFPPAMPPVPLKPEEVDALVEYLKTIR